MTQKWWEKIKNSSKGWRMAFLFLVLLVLSIGLSFFFARRVSLNLQRFTEKSNDSSLQINSLFEGLSKELQEIEKMKEMIAPVEESSSGQEATDDSVDDSIKENTSSTEEETKNISED